MIKNCKSLLRCILVLALCACLVCVSVHSTQAGFSSSYTRGIFYRRLCNIQLTGDQRTDIVNVAMSQLGYTEGNGKTELSGLAGGNKNYTEYGLWYDNIYGPEGFNHAAWCASFVSWCAYQAGISKQTVYYHAFTPYGLSWFEDQGLAYSRAQVEKGNYTPQPGDIVYFKSSANNQRVNHVGIVVRYEDGILYAVEGNTRVGSQTSDGGQVCLKSYKISNTFIRYICCPNYT